MMYSCGHNSEGENVPEYWKLLPHERMPASSGECTKCRQDRDRYINTIFLIPPITRVLYTNKSTGEAKESLEFDPKAAGVIKNVK